MLKSFRWMSTLIILVIAGILVARFYLGITRYLDVDEFAHLHWTYLMTHGQLPYRDFFLYHIPLFQWFLSPLFLLPPSLSLIILSRIVLWVLFIANLFILYRITVGITHSKITGFMAILIMTIFPMTFDKSIEVRPDFLMTFFFLMSMVLIMRTKLRSHNLLVAGIFYSLAILTFPKILFAAPALLFLLFHRLNKDGKLTHFRDYIPFVSGFLLPTSVFIIYLLGNNIFPRAIDAIFRDSVAVSEGKGPFSLWLALSPYPLVYVTSGNMSFPWIINTALWISSALGLLYLRKRKSHYAIFFILFFLGALIFLYAFPAPYLQYFLPLSLCASLLSAIFFDKTFSFLSRHLHTHITYSALYVCVIALFVFSFWQQYQERIGPDADYHEQKAVVENILKISKPEDTVYDMVGSYIFRPDGYFICCHPYAEFVDRLSMKVPTLRDSLRARHTKFVILDRTGQSLWKPKQEDLDFLHTNYAPSKYPKIYVQKDQQDLLQ